MSGISSEVEGGLGVKEGWLWKKCPKGMKGFHPWQKRWIHIDDRHLTYYSKRGDKKVLGTIDLVDITACEHFLKKRVGDRFDIRVRRRKRVFAFHAENSDDAVTWVGAIVNRVKIAQANGKNTPVYVKKQTVAEDELPKSPLLLMFAKVMFGNGIHSPITTLEAEEKQRLIQSMKLDFKTEDKMLSWLLTNAMHSSTGQWKWDVRSDRDVEKDALTRQPGVLLQCSVDGCKISTISTDEKFCVFHKNTRSGAIDEKTRREFQILEMFKSADFLRHLQRVFDGPDQNAHGLAIKVLWALFYGMYDRTEAAKQFDSYISIICNGPKLSLAIWHSLVYMMLTHPNEFNTDDPMRIGFYNPVLNESIWKPMFGVLCGSDWKVREKAFQDVTTVLFDCFDNCQTLERTPNWQNWVFGVLLDIMKKDKNEDQTVKTCFVSCISTITQVHFEYFRKCKNPDEFKRVVLSTLIALYNFGAVTMESGQIAGVLLGALITKLSKSKKIFSFDYQSHEWANFFQLREVIKKYIFRTAFWNREFIYHSADDEKKEQLEGSGRKRGNSESEFTGGEETSSMRKPVPSVKPTAVSKFVLTRSRQKNPQAFDDEDDIKEYGLHYGEDGACYDVALCDKMINLFKVLGVDVFDSNLRPTVTEIEKAALKKLERHHIFWCDAKNFCESIRLQDIEEYRFTTHRRVQHWAKEFLEKQKKRTDRQGIVDNIKKTIAKKAAGKEGGTSPMHTSPPQTTSYSPTSTYVSES